MRPAATETEAWAAAGLVFVQACDDDRAQEENGVGFSKYDNAFGHSLADRLKSTGRLTEKQWQAAIKLATKYRRQIGPKPEETQ